MSIGEDLRPRPAADFAQARAQFDALSARDDARISAAGRSRFYDHGRRTGRAVVLLHGLTNAPEQWAPFAAELHARGDTVVVPRFPGHGHVDRATREIATVGAAALLGTAGAAVDIACGAGERVTLAGLSVGGAMAAWLALSRADLTHSIAISPFIGVARCNEPVNRCLTFALGALPNVFVPWDPGGDNAQIPPYAYAKFPTRVLAACLGIGLDALRRAQKQAPEGHLDFILNGREPACNNALAVLLAERALRRRSGSTTTTQWNDLPPIHDIIDPTNPQARTDLVYPRLLSLIATPTG